MSDIQCFQCCSIVTYVLWTAEACIVSKDLPILTTTVSASYELLLWQAPVVIDDHGARDTP